jgi:hypothetical protein
MLRKSLILIYIVAVLLIAGFARAESDRSIYLPHMLPITKADYDAKDFSLHVSGYFTDTCQSNPRLVVESVDTSDKVPVAHLHVVAQGNIDGRVIRHLCNRAPWGFYELISDIRTLKLPPSATLILEVGDADVDNIHVFRASVPFNIPGFGTHSENREGVLVRTRQMAEQLTPYSYGLKTPTGIILLDMPVSLNAQLDAEVGSRIHVAGIPTQQPQSNDESGLLEFAASTPDASPLMIVLEVNSLF